MLNIGDACDDGDAGTYNDVVDANCVCAGTPYDCPNLMANIGDACDDGDPNTSVMRWTPTAYAPAPRSSIART